MGERSETHERRPSRARIYTVTKSRSGDWVAEGLGSVVARAPRMNDAVQAALQVARAHQPATVRIRKANGALEAEWRYPRPSTSWTRRGS